MQDFCFKVNDHLLQKFNNYTIYFLVLILAIPLFTQYTTHVIVAAVLFLFILGISIDFRRVVYYLDEDMNLLFARCLGGFLGLVTSFLALHVDCPVDSFLIVMIIGPLGVQFGSKLYQSQ